jgi:hypothetical protein
MPRRNRNANTAPIDADELAAGARGLAAQLIAVTDYQPLCAGCRTNPATDGDYCLLCKGHIVSSARKTTVIRR